MRENCTSGSVRGASGNRGSYRKRRLVTRWGSRFMTTKYDAIAEEYKRAKLQPWRFIFAIRKMR